MCSVLVSAQGLLFQHIDIKKRVKFLCSALFFTWKNQHYVQKPQPRSYLAPSLASSCVAP